MEICQLCDSGLPVYKTDGKGISICKKCAEGGGIPRKPRAVEKTQSRNELCSCASGKKYKNCCIKQ